MSKHPLSLSALLERADFPGLEDNEAEVRLQELKLRMVRVQQGLWHRKGRAIIALEGFDASGKGGAIRHITEKIDPRGYRVYPIGPPGEVEHGRHWLYRFWKKLPAPGTLSIFDRTWYGRGLVERVEKLIDKETWRRAYDEINQFEALLAADGIDIVKIFLGISKDEQRKRFEDRLRDPYKQWKLTGDDIRARKKWDRYVEATDEIFGHTDTKQAPWRLVPADDKKYARVKTLELVCEKLDRYASWMESKAAKMKSRSLKESLKQLRG